MKHRLNTDWRRNETLGDFPSVFHPWLKTDAHSAKLYTDGAAERGPARICDAQLVTAMEQVSREQNFSVKKMVWREGLRHLAASIHQRLAGVERPKIFMLKRLNAALLRAGAPSRA